MSTDNNKGTKAVAKPTTPQTPAFSPFRNLLDTWGLNDHFFESFRNGKDLPAANISETEDSLVIELAIPGMEKKDFNISLEDGVLSIGSEQEQESASDEKNYRRREYSFHSFERRFSIPDTIDEESLKATYAKGILTVNLKREPVEARKRIDIPVS
jgi:HSP20 family protein